jgi:putative tricarboxylic transport membrane protein
VGRDRWSAAALALVAIAYLFAARRYPLDTLATPGPGVMPLVAGVALLAAAIWLFVAPGPARTVAAPGQLLRAPLILAATLVLYAALLPRVGFVVSSLVLVIVSARLMGLPGWWRPAALALGLIAASHVVFVRWLGVPLP